MPKYVTQNGKPVSATDPKRAVWYSARCSYWTDDWSKVVKVGPGIPACPTCQSVGFIADADKFLKDVVDTAIGKIDHGPKERCNAVLTHFLPPEASS